jgi:hypothetical protein
MVHTIVDGTFRQTNLTNESSGQSRVDGGARDGCVVFAGLTHYTSPSFWTVTWSLMIIVRSGVFGAALVVGIGCPSGFEAAAGGIRCALDF